MPPCPLLFHFLLGLADQGEVAILVEVVIRLKQHHIVPCLGLFMVEVLYCLQVLLFEVFLLELEENLVFFFEFVEPLEEHSHVGGDLFRSLGLDL